MKTLIVTPKQMRTAGRWDIDFHLPPTGIRAFPPETLHQIRDCADIVKSKRDPTLMPDATFRYVDISSIDVETGVIARPQELTGAEAPSRARKVIHAYDVIISTCRPTRGAIAVIPEELHGEICSTGFSVVKARAGTNPFYLHFALRLASTLEQFRKWSTGSSYPAILDEDVEKTLIPLPDGDAQDLIAGIIRCAMAGRARVIMEANQTWQQSMDGVVAALSGTRALGSDIEPKDVLYSTAEVRERLASLPAVEEEESTPEEELLECSLFTNGDDPEVS